MTMEKLCEFKEWSIADYLKKIEDDQIALPKFQRGVSWRIDQQRRLISSIRQGFPIGVILLAQRSWDQPNKFSIIDGLQRTAAIRQYKKNPIPFIGTADNEYPTSWTEFGMWIAGKHSSSPATVSVINDFLYGFLSDTDLDFPDQLKFYDKVTQYFGPSIKQLADDRELRTRANAFFRSIKDELDISTVLIPVILYSGHESLLPEIFERLNSEGVKLTKYQIFAASWQRSVNCSHEDVLNAIVSFYSRRLRDSDIEIDGVGEDGKPEALTLFDYLTGLSTVLVERYPMLFATGWADDIAFAIASVAHGCQIGKMAKLEDYFAKDNDGNILTDDFTSALLAACDDTNRALRARLGLKLNSTRPLDFAGHTEFQIGTIITRLLVEHFNREDWGEKVRVSGREQRDQFVRRWYLIDRLRRAWGNAGDSQFFRQVWETLRDDTGKDLLVPSKATLQKIPDEDLCNVLDAWFSEEMRRRDRARQSVSSETKLVLRYFYVDKLSVLDEEERRFQLDHLVPISWWKEFFKRYKQDEIEASGPINAIGNLCLMIDNDNKSKLKKLPLPWFRKARVDEGPDFEARCKENYFLIDPEHLGYPENAGDLAVISSENTALLKSVKASLQSTSEDRWALIRKDLLKTLADD
jgi:hypothetical protein